jgi:hypothetical protein
MTTTFLHMVSVPKEGHHVATALYIFSGWLLFNVLLAVGMYFRPVRKRAAGSTDDRTLEPGSNTRARFSEADQHSSNDLGTQRSIPGLRRRNGGPAALSKVLFFGFWLRDRRGSV